jgi:hypothetical protein
MFSFAIAIAIAIGIGSYDFIIFQEHYDTDNSVIEA